MTTPPDLLIYEGPLGRPARPGDAGIDLAYSGDEPLLLHPGQMTDVPTGVRVKIPDGWVGLIKSRSSTFRKRRIVVWEGVIDSGYTGELFLLCWNPANKATLIVSPGDRLGQIILVKHAIFSEHPYHTTEGSEGRVQADLRIIEANGKNVCIPGTERGDDGFGSTGGHG